MAMVREILEKAIKEALSGVGVKADVSTMINFEHPKDISYGDYSTNIAMVMFGEMAKALDTHSGDIHWTLVKTDSPKIFAQNLVEKINKNLPKEVSKVEVAGPGFINFYLSEEYFIKSVGEILKEKEKFGANKKLKGAKTVIEYTDPNPFKEFHIGHLMSNAIGESISRIVEANGAKVIRACYQGDVGLHVAKAVWAMTKKTNTYSATMSGLIYSPRDAFELGQAYAQGDSAYRNDEKAKNEIIEINKKIYSIDPKKEYPALSVEGWYKNGRKKSLDYFEEIYKILGTKFDEYFFESKAGPFGKEIVEKNIGKVFEKGDNNSIIFKGENYGLHTRVFINSEGIPTYEAKELGLSKIKYDKTKYDRSIIITGNEINEYFKVLLKAMSLIFPDLAAKTSHVSHGMLRLPEGKMSSRTGDVITAVSLLNDIEAKVAEKMTDREMTDSEKKKVAEEVAVGALKYSILRQVTGKDIIFDFDKSLSFEGDSGPYLQYSYARARSILRKAKEARIKGNMKMKSGEKKEMTELEKMLYRFPEVVERAGSEYSPHYIATYLIELASSFNAFYAKNKIVDEKDIFSPYKVALTESFSIVLKNGLNLLGIQAPERM